MSELPEADKSTFNRIVAAVVRHYMDVRATGQPVPAWLQRQVDAVYLIETDPGRGISELVEGMQDEMDYLAELKHG